MTHVVLLGDSIFDNAAYVPGEPAVIDQLREILPHGWSATLLAVDGHVTADVAGQLDMLPADASHLVISCGGNDALGYLPLLEEKAGSFVEVLDRLSMAREEFRVQYRSMLRSVSATLLETAVCTVYDCVPGLPRSAHAALGMFNEVILREAVAARVSIVDLRLVCPETSDYSEISPIEPSRAGGEKIARVIRDMLLGDPSRPTIAIHA